MSATMQLDIVSAEGLIFSGRVDRFFAAAANGEVGVLPHHTQLISILKPLVILQLITLYPLKCAKYLRHKNSTVKS